MSQPFSAIGSSPSARLLVAAILLSFTGCTEKQNPPREVAKEVVSAESSGIDKVVTIEDDTAERPLTYRCGAFAPQATSGKDIGLIFRAAKAEMKKLRARKNTAGALSLIGALQSHDIARAEELVVSSRCNEP